MTSISSVFSSRKAYVGYLTAGDGGYAHSRQAMLALIEGGIDILEVGLPFSDPVADGPTIQKAAERALQAGTQISTVLALCKEIRKTSAIPLILFSYYNPIFCHGPDFYAKAKHAGVNGILVVDLPLNEAETHLKECEQHGLDPIFLISPSTSTEKIKALSNVGRGMLYYVCRNGTTGVRKALPEGLKTKLRQIKNATHLPVVVGFGLSSKEMAKAVTEIADGFVVGSLFVDKAYESADLSELTALAKEIDPRE